MQSPITHSPRSARVLRCGRTVCLVFVGATAVMSARATPQTDAGQIDSVRAAMEKWVETRRVISHEQREWTLARETLNDRIALVEREIAALREKIAESDASLAETDQTYASLVDENDRLKEASVSLEEDVAVLEERTLELLNRLPEPILKLVRPLSQAMSSTVAEKAEEGKTETSLGIRYQNVAGILNLVNKFNREISANSDTRPMTDGTSVNVTAMYIGLGQAYYVNAAETRGGVGRPGEEGFVWTPVDSSAADIARAIAILKNEQIAEFVPLPLELGE